MKLKSLKIEDIVRRRSGFSGPLGYGKFGNLRGYGENSYETSQGNKYQAIFDDLDEDELAIDWNHLGEVSTMGRSLLGEDLEYLKYF